MNENPVISIVSVVLNDADNLDKTIKSVACQDYEHIEYLVIDGGSTDNSVDIIRKWQDRVDFWISEPDDGIYDAMNRGIENATGKYVVFLNSGDELAACSVISEFCNIVGGQSGLALYLAKVVTSFGKVLVPANIKFRRNYILPACHQGIIYPTQALKETGFSMKYRIAADFHNYHLLTDKYEARIVDVLLSKYDMGGLSSTSRGGLEKEYLDIIDELGIPKFFKLYRRFQSLTSSTNRRLKKAGREKNVAE